jgi:hypothetical protein
MIDKSPELAAAAERMTNWPLCFVLMPLCPTLDGDGQRIDFTAVYERLIAPSIRDAGMAPLRADEEVRGGIFQKTMFERLVVCEFAVADLSTGNPNVYYELGVRHGQRPYSTVLMFRRGWRLPLDLAHGAALDYPIDTSGVPVDIEVTRTRLAERLRQARTATVDSPVYQLVSGLPVPEVDHARIDTFRDHAARDEGLKRRLDDAQRDGRNGIRTVEDALGDTGDLDGATVLALIVAYRSVEAWSEIVSLVRRASPPVARLEVIRQQFAMALNRCERGSEAEDVLRTMLAQRASSETYGLLGRVQKDRWKAATSPAQRRGLLRRAIDAYLCGFEADFRDPYPGINAVTLMSVADPPDERREELLPVVRYAVSRRLARQDPEPDYWDHATDLGLAVLEDDRERAEDALGCCLATARDSFQLTTTGDDLTLVHDAAKRRGEDADWVAELVHELRKARSGI